VPGPLVFAHTQRSLGAFHDEHLERSTVIHLLSCPAGLDGAGRSNARALCQCLGRGKVVQSKTTVQVLQQKGEASLVALDTTRPFWVERQGLEPTDPPQGWGTGMQIDLAQAENRERRMQEALKRPQDIVLFESWLEGHEIWTPVRGRPRTIRSGEIVVLKEGLRESTPSSGVRPWRVLGRTQTDIGYLLVLVDPSLRPDQVLQANWSQVWRVCLDGPEGRKGADHVVIGVFPLPDGTPSPGWSG